MTLGAALVIVDILVVVLILYFVLPRPWPEPHDRPFVCNQCRRSYRDASSLAWHKTGQHPELLTDDESCVSRLAAPQEKN